MEGGHSVPIEKIVSRYGKSISNCKKLILLVDRLYVYDNSIENQPARLLFRIADGKLIKQYLQNLSRWAEILHESL